MSKKIFFLLVLILFSNGCATQSYVELGNEKISVEVVDTVVAMSEGLMYREELCENCGMLFVFKTYPIIIIPGEERPTRGFPSDPGFQSKKSLVIRDFYDICQGIFGLDMS